ncbi:TPA: hypothetical protein ACGSTL_001425 [Vibrio parahaemolyticus]|uniref:hypothetical protein n=1 Tax=Vibrio campbellii TaxID=680 RepID=UPI001F0839B2|nr:hypothetical protein [Vibrio campbellii]UMM06870.1 hypothetical protein MKR81_26785 [Vibrio campbellii]
MFVLPFQKLDVERDRPAYGFSVSALPKSVLWLSGFFGVVALSSTYHSLLYGYTMPDWSIPVTVMSVLPFGYRIRVALSNDKTTLYRQNALFGLKIKEKVWESSSFDRLVIKATEVVEKQFYIIVSGTESDVSVHICRMRPKKLLSIHHRLRCMLGLSKGSK